jgi:hypothetical protein
MKTIVFSMGGLMACALAACAHTGDVTERTPVTTPLASYGTAQVMVQASDPSAVNSAQHVTLVEQSLISKLRNKGVFQKINEGEGALNVKVTLVSAGGGSGALQAMNAGGDAKVQLLVDLTDPKDNHSIGQLEVTGNSASNVHTSVGGVDTQAMSDQTPKAIDAATDQLVEYLAKKK